ncbi:SDR family NAD(P)-dependent oxidoreductase [Mycolicibacterium hippocampi]|nr:SDR family NAD(P)-dependent oxidoreductase [Mycolicibacterium hippocampi]
MNTTTETIVMTGATRGIGFRAAQDILRRSPGTHLVLLARENTGAEALHRLHEISPEVSMISTDLASKASIETAAAQLEDRLDGGELSPLRGVVCNGGVHLADALHTTVDGYETTFAVNVLSTHLLLRRLHPHLRAPTRIVVTVSDAHFGDFRHTAGTLPPPRWSTPEILAHPGAFDRPDRVRAGRRAYATSKLAGIHLVHEWARRLPEAINIVSYNPSLVTGTGLARDAGGAFPFLMKWIVPVLEATPIVDTAPVAGRKLADVVLGVTTAPTGAYIHRTQATASSAESYDTDRERELWDWMEQASASDAR